MRTRIIAIGNSHGITIPKRLLEHAGLARQVELRAERGRIRDRRRVPNRGDVYLVALDLTRGSEICSHDRT